MSPDSNSALRLPDLTGQRVLITGGLGFVGSNLAHQCLALGAQVTVYDNLDPRCSGNIHNIDGIRDRIRVEFNDILNFEAITASIVQNDVIFHCAAYVSHPNSMRDPLIDIDVNCKGVIHVLEAARRFNPAIRVVYAGTSTQIGKMRYSPIDELHPEFPVDIYSANKSASEKYTLLYSTAYGLFTTVVRFSNTFGPRANIKSPEFGFMNYFFGLAMQNKPLTVFGDGSQLRNVIFVEDCVSAMIMASQDEQANNQVFFAVGDTQHSVAEIAEAIVEVVGSGTVKFIEWPEDRRVIEVGDAVISNARIGQVLGWRPQHDLRTGLAKMKAYFAPRLKFYL